MKPRSRGAEPDVLVRMVDIPMSAVSWNPSKPGGRDRGRGGARGAAVKDGPAAPRGTGPAPGRGSRVVDGGADPGAGGRFDRRPAGGGGLRAPRGAGASGVSIEGDSLRIRTGGGR
jgi:hypothetical protein